jgi:hypothetical protein
MALEADMVAEGRVVNGVVVPDEGSRLPEGARVHMTVVADSAGVDEYDPELDKLVLPDPSLPPGHPLGPYDRETELAILRKSIEDMKAGNGGMTLQEFDAEFRKEFKLPPE